MSSDLPPKQTETIMNGICKLLSVVIPLCFVPLGGWAATFCTATNGSNGNPGTTNLPWLTIQHAAETLEAGDTVVVRAGTYDERVSTARGGTGDLGRITFQADGAVTMKGWVIDHPYITVDGFDITGWSSANRNNAHVDVNNDGDWFELLNCAVRDGVQAVRDDMMFHAGSNMLSSATGGFLAARFAAGQALYVGGATNGQTILNSGLHTITNVTDNSLTVSSSLADDGPLFIYLSSSYVFGLALGSGTENAVVRGNLFSNLGYDTWIILGSGHVIESNIIEQVNGWDAMHFGGDGHMFRHNLIRNSPLTVYQVSPDAMENFPTQPYSNVTFDHNFIFGFAGVLASQKGQGTSTGLYLTHNVFADVGRFAFTHPDTLIENNTFLRSARVSYPVVSLSSHPVYFNANSAATNSVVRNNIFVECGEPNRFEEEEEVGWYEISGPSESITTDFNYVAGGAPTYTAKTDFDEGHPNLNGGDPGFVDATDPLGPDGLPFTADDGLQLLPGSKLRDAGYQGVDLGAYPAAPVRPVMSMVAQAGDTFRIGWLAMYDEFTLMEASEIAGPWIPATESPAIEGNHIYVTVPETGEDRFFILDK